MSGKVYPLQDNQARAVAPEDSVWLSASAGTGKTQVLSARVLRLLLRRDVRPEQILCLTFTKAGAAEMTTRVNDVLASWVRMKPEALASDLKAIGAGVDPHTMARARSLFASVLDCPGGGLRIDTIHAFAQWLLAAFPEEADLTPGTRPMEDRDRELLARKVLSDMLVEAENSSDRKLTDAVAELSIRLGPDGARAFLMRSAEAREAWFGPGAWQPPMLERTKQLLGVPSDLTDDDIASQCSDEQFDIASLRRVLDVYRQWGTKSAVKTAGPIEEWLANDPEKRLSTIAELEAAIFNKEGAPKYLNSVLKIDPAIADVADGLHAEIERIRGAATLLGFAEFLAPALEAGRAFALRWEEAKQREGFIDFDDQIRRAAELLANSELSAWVRYKLDRRFDHILIDEAQDTNAAQWTIIDALTDDFFSGAGQREGRQRTLFVVGDYKQAIFGFQGTSPENFAQAREKFAELMRAAKANAEQLRERIDARELVELGLGRSYRSAQPVLDFVDAAIGAIGPSEFGLRELSGEHVGLKTPGLVRMWQPVPGVEQDADDPEGPDWISEPERRMADRIAVQIKHWLDEGYPLVKDAENPRNAGPGDIMVLVRKRRELAGMIVARLYAASIPVAGVDRLRLGAPLAVKDLMAALRFATQPLDSLSLASLLVSPLLGWSQDELLEHGYRDEGVSLWDHLRRSDTPFVLETVDRLRDLLALADFEPPQALLHWLLVGPWQGRAKLAARLGTDAHDPIDELLNAALAYASAHTPSLQGFIQWFDAGEGELKREQGESDGLVRVMTVHGSKGLQAPIVILADATGNPDSSPLRDVSLTDPMEGARRLPIPPPRKEERTGRIAERVEELAAAEREEHWRLLYVAMTRAEEALFIGGALGKREKAPAPDSWYARLEALFDGDALEDDIWGMRRDWGEQPEPVKLGKAEDRQSIVDLPIWAKTPIGEEPRPPRPLAPSGLGDETGSDPPLAPEQLKVAAQRGVLIHALLERLPEVAAEAREAAGRAWLERHAKDLPAKDRADMLASALSVLGDDQFARVFAEGSLPEVPIAAELDGQVIAGTIDRLLITESEIVVVDFKTARRPPDALEKIPDSTLRQMGAYAAALEKIFPGRTISAAILYTQTPQLMALSPEILEAQKPRFHIGEERFAPQTVE
ncbi:double-strand break repair helicase AddA [Altererythrobacter sp. MF3-039]|uniref:double-strand break repair helicase AddA n=1 Tax=Altererythrobacter sp. MF3-039 TaxID=3252901 RepID=UPI00390CA1A4